MTAHLFHIVHLVLILVFASDIGMLGCCYWLHAAPHGTGLSGQYVVHSLTICELYMFVFVYCNCSDKDDCVTISASSHMELFPDTSFGVIALLWTQTALPR